MAKQKRSKKPKKNSWIAAILNFLFWGGGYVYNGKNRKYGILLISIMVISYILKPLLLPVGSGLRALVSLIFIVMRIYFAIDGYKEAKTV